MNSVLEDLAREQRARAVLRDRTSTVPERDAARVVLGLPEVVCGTRNRYVNDRCRCDDCKAANTEYFRVYRDRLRRGDLLVLCWCEQAIVAVPAATVKVGRTHSCGAKGCGP